MRKKRVTRNKSKAAVLWMWEHTKMIVNCLSVCTELAVFPDCDCDCDKGNRTIQLP